VQQGSLYDNLYYPHARDGGVARSLLPDDACTILRAVGLPELAAADPAAVADWSRRLSAGEQQRLAVARTLLAAPQLVRHYAVISILFCD
jgi:ABC-type uncharacterized transport system fused permease/ATPase subunit